MIVVSYILLSLLTVFIALTFNIGLALDDDIDLLIKLDCEPAEKRTYSYESQTQLWGTLEENLLVSAEVLIHCMGYNDRQINGTKALKYMVEIKNVKPRVMREKQNEIANLKRSKRSVGSWFKQAWRDVKDFFVNLFTSRSNPNDNDFDVIGKEASTTSKQYQCKSSKERAKRSTDATNHHMSEAIVYDKMFDIPFVFLQLVDGRVAEVRFSDKDSDITVKNFKRHIADAFATQLNANKQKVFEQSPIGSHVSRYSFDDSGSLERSIKPTADGNSFKLGGVSFGGLNRKTTEQTTKPNTISIMRDVTPEDVMQVGNGNGIVFDQIDINAKQIQQISEGRLTATAGHLSLSLINPNKISQMRPKRSADDSNNDDIVNYMKVRTKYSLTFTKSVTKRSADNTEQELKKLKDMESKLNFRSETIVSESSTENSRKEKLKSLRKHLNEIIGNHNNNNEQQLLKYSSDNENPVYHTILRALSLEVKLNEDKHEPSISYLMRSRLANEKNLNDVCGHNIALNNIKCRDLLLVLIKSQSNFTVNTLLKSLRTKSSVEEKSEILRLIVQTPKPLNTLIKELINTVKTESNSNYEGILLLAISNLAHNSDSEQLKTEVSQLLTAKLSSLSCVDNSSTLLVDVLEAIGNLGHQSTIDYSEQTAERCSQSDAIQVAVIHSIRKLASNQDIQHWLLKRIKDPKTSCVINQEIVAMLIEDIDSIETSSSSDAAVMKRWPKYQFNEIDRILSEKAIKMKNSEECLHNTYIRYFEHKSDAQSKAVLKKIITKLRAKREIFSSFWNEANCREWKRTETDNKIDSNTKNTDTIEPLVISDKLRESEEVDTSSVSYRRRKKCSASRRFGPSQAQAIFRADIVNDLTGTDEDPQYKLMAQFVVGTHFLGTDIDIGKMYVFHRKDSSRAYVNLFGNTLVDARASDCSEDSSSAQQSIQPYVSTNYFPLYDFNVWIVHMSMGIRLTGEMNFDLPFSNCASKKSESQQLKQINLTPEARVSASGEASGKVLVMKGGINIGGDFNYFSNLELKPDAELCLSVYNGYKPMNVSIASWYQFYHPSCSEWMERSVWSPKTWNWKITDNHRSAWIQNECLLTDSTKAKKGDTFEP